MQGCTELGEASMGIIRHKEEFQHIPKAIKKKHYKR